MLRRAPLLPEGPTTILVALGANLPNAGGLPPSETCRQAAARLDGLLGCRLRGLSRWFLTAPIPDVGQPAYVNAVAQLDAVAPPPAAELLAALLRLEAEHGRVRVPGSLDRTLDLDLLAVGSQVRSAPDPVLPHPRLHVRRFVLDPLCDVAPAWHHPTLGKTAQELRDAVTDQAARPLPG